MTQITDHLNPDTLSAFVDGESSTDEVLAIQQHLAECHACALQILSAMQVKAATARAGQRFAPSPETLARLTASLPSKRPKNVAWVFSFPHIAWTALAAVLLLTVSLFGWQQIHQARTLPAELLDQHLATLASGAAPEVISTDNHTVKPWFQGKLSFSFNLPNTLPADTALKGGDLAFLSGQPAALLLFTIHKHQVSVFLTPRSGSSIGLLRSGTRSGFSIHDATTTDLRIIAVSDVNPVELDLLLSALVQAQSP